MRAHDGLITLEDLKNYVAKERVPLRTTYRGFEVISMPPPSSGGAVLIEMLNILEGFDLRHMGAAASERYHVQTEAMRRAFADRLRRGIKMERASTSAEVKAGRPAGAESEETTHFTVVDAEGNCVSNTYTLNLGYGSGVVAKG